MRLFLCGDLMLARGIDQILPSPSNPELHEPYVTDARQYVRLAEEVNGPIPRAVDAPYVWGDLLEVLDRESPDVRVGNLETSVTTSDEYDRDKGIHYRMSPENASVLQPPQFDCLTLANNHVLDWGRAGLEETLATLRREEVGCCGAGRNHAEARAPCVSRGGVDGRVAVWAVGDRSSGIPRSWSAGEDRPGVRLKPATRDLVSEIAGGANGSVRVVSIHWGENWGYAIPRRQQKLARVLIDEAGVSVVHGHSSHHPKGVEFYNGGLILYGSGDFMNDYEGIGGHERYRPELTAGYLVDIDAATGRAERGIALAFRLRRFRLERASGSDTQWLAETLHRVSPRGSVGFAAQSAGRIAFDRVA
jgi:poly-gamma-glutamate synthesis protein (capsule biosynthesis protein)